MNWRTTVLGVMTIFAAVGTAAVALLDNDPTTVVNLPVTIAAITSGLGLIFAKDAANKVLP